MTDARGLGTNLVDSTRPGRSSGAVSCGDWAPVLAACLVLAGCAGAAAGSEERYPEKKRPDAPRSASDDEVLGAQRQDPADTLAGSLTTGHAAPRSPHAEEPAEAAHERLEYEQCVEASKAPVPVSAAASAGNGAPLRRPVCPPPPPSDD